MLKKLLLFLLLGISAQHIPAQNNANEAKAAYLLAEEAYGKSDYRAALDYLQQAKIALGANNCKLLFLQIQATRELLAKDPNNGVKIMPLITEFENQPDFADFNEEKKLEISKLKLVIKAEQKKLADAREKALALKASRDKYFDSIVLSSGPFNISLDELDSLHPNWKLKNWKSYKISPTVDFLCNPSFGYDKSIFPFPELGKQTSAASVYTGIFLTNGKVTGYQVITLGADLGSKLLKASYDNMVDVAALTIKGLSQQLNFAPVVTNFSIKGENATRYLWSKGKYGFMYEELHFPQRGGGVMRLMKTVFSENPVQ